MATHKFSREIELGKVTIAVIVALYLVGCASSPKQVRPMPARQAPAQHAPAEPGLLVPQTLTLRGPATLSSVSGACYIVRGEGGVVAQQGAVLQDGDVLDLGNAEDNGSAAIHSTGKSDIVLRRSMGRFFKLQIRP